MRVTLDIKVAALDIKVRTASRYSEKTVKEAAIRACPNVVRCITGVPVERKKCAREGQILLARPLNWF